MSYQSKYNLQKPNCSPQHYIAEIICERMAKRSGDDLCQKFWNTDKWKRIYRVQLMAAINLLKIYPTEVIIQSLRQSPTTYSLMVKWLDPLFKQNMAKHLQQIELLKEKAAKPAEELPTEGVSGRKDAYKKKKSVRSTLEDIDNG